MRFTADNTMLSAVSTRRAQKTYAHRGVNVILSDGPNVSSRDGITMTHQIPKARRAAISKADALRGISIKAGGNLRGSQFRKRRDRVCSRSIAAKTSVTVPKEATRPIPDAPQTAANFAHRPGCASDAAGTEKITA